MDRRNWVLGNTDEKTDRAVDWKDDRQRQKMTVRHEKDMNRQTDGDRNGWTE